jgi:hypothetical protein
MAGNSKLRALGIVAVVAFLALLVVMTLQETGHRYEVCVEFKGQTHCAVAEGKTPEDAIRSAQEIGCTLLANGRDENIQCTTQPPKSTRAIKK